MCVVQGNSVDLGGRRTIKKKGTTPRTKKETKGEPPKNTSEQKGDKGNLWLWRDGIPPPHPGVSLVPRNSSRLTPCLPFVFSFRWTLEPSKEPVSGIVERETKGKTERRTFHSLSILQGVFLSFEGKPPFVKPFRLTKGKPFRNTKENPGKVERGKQGKHPRDTKEKPGNNEREFPERWKGKNEGKEGVDQGENEREDQGKGLGKKKGQFSPTPKNQPFVCLSGPLCVSLFFRLGIRLDLCLICRVFLCISSGKFL